jgi:DNA-binding ferritin-like protein (Dps family)
MTMAKNILELIIGSIDDKKQWRAYVARVKALPEPYRAAVGAIEHYLMSAGGIPNDWKIAAKMLDDLADLFERAALDGTPLRDIVGDDPLEFVETFVATYSDGGWVAKERERLRTSIARAAGEEADA